MGYGYVWPWRPSFHALSAVRKTPISEFFGSQDAAFAPNQKFQEISSSIASNLAKSLVRSKAPSWSKASNWAKSQFTWLQFVKKFSSIGSHILKLSVHKAPLHTYNKMKVECPPQSLLMEQSILPLLSKARKCSWKWSGQLFFWLFLCITNFEVSIL